MGENVTYDFSREREVWRAFFGKRNARHFSRLKKKAQKEADVIARQLFHPESGAHLNFPEFLQHWADMLERGENFEGTSFKWISQFHPNALRFLAEFGTLQHPLVFTERPRIEPMPGDCCENAYLNMHRHKIGGPKLSYTEGLVMGAGTNPMLHAWNVPVDDHTTAIDWTFYTSARWSKYFGIVLTANEHAEVNTLLFDNGHYSLLLDKDRWTPKLESFLRELLSDRKSSNAAE